jgi:arsenical pump membrane protein
MWSCHAFFPILHREPLTYASAFCAQGDACLRDGGWLHCRYCQPTAGRVELGQHRLGRLLRHRIRALCRGGAGELGVSGRTLGALVRSFRKDIPADYDLAQLKRLEGAIYDRSTFLTDWCVLAMLLVGFFWLDDIRIPISAVAAAGAVLLLAVAARGHRISTREVLRGAPWQVVVFSLGMYLLVYGLRNAGLTDYLTALLDRCAAHGIWGAALSTSFITAILSSIMNNMPTVLMGALAIDASSDQGVVREAVVYANVIGADLGRKITPIGSLATLLWLHVLSTKSIQISWATTSGSVSY